MHGSGLGTTFGKPTCLPNIVHEIIINSYTPGSYHLLNTGGTPGSDEVSSPEGTLYYILIWVDNYPMVADRVESCEWNVATVIYFHATWKSKLLTYKNRHEDNEDSLAMNSVLISIFSINVLGTPPKRSSLYGR